MPSRHFKMLRNTIDFIQLITKTSNNFRMEINFNSGEITSSLRVLCPTRWTVRHASISSILKKYKVLQSTLEEVQEGHDEYAAKANGLFNKMEQFEHILDYYFHFLYLVLLNNFLQMFRL